MRDTRTKKGITPQIAECASTLDRFTMPQPTWHIDRPFSLHRKQSSRMSYSDAEVKGALSISVANRWFVVSGDDLAFPRPA
jgi:hypothetical protein